MQKWIFVIYYATMQFNYDLLYYASVQLVTFDQWNI